MAAAAAFNSEGKVSRIAVVLPDRMEAEAVRLRDALNAALAEALLQ